MKIDSIRFGTIEVPDEELIHFPNGVIGFPEERAFVLLRHGDSDVVAWLQSTQTPQLAFPVVSAHGLSADYPDVDVIEFASNAGLGELGDDYAVIAVLSASRFAPATVNLLAPIVINATQRIGGQLFLDGSRFTTRELFVLPNSDEDAADAAEEEAADAERKSDRRRYSESMSASPAAE